MDLKEKVCRLHNEKKIHILKDELGNVATGTSYFEALKFGIILKRKDFENLKNWIENELDNVSIIEILSCLPDLKQLLKNEISLFNKTAITVVEKLFL